jgi:hypothetical protein
MAKERILLDEGFAMDMAISKIGSIKPLASGSYEGHAYSASVKFKTTNVEQIDDEVLGLKEVETSIWIKIPCSNNEDVILLNNYLRDKKNKGEVFKLKTTLPRQSDAETFTCTSLQNANAVMGVSEKKAK